MTDSKKDKEIAACLMLAVVILYIILNAATT